MIPVFKEVVKGMNTGGEKKVTIPSKQVYGSHLDEIVIEMDRNKIPENMHSEKGGQLQITN